MPRFRLIHVFYRPKARTFNAKVSLIVLLRGYRRTLSIKSPLKCLSRAKSGVFFNLVQSIAYPDSKNYFSIPLLYVREVVTHLVTYLYSNLLYKMVNYFLDRQYIYVRVFFLVIFSGWWPGWELIMFSLSMVLLLDGSSDRNALVWRENFLEGNWRHFNNKEIKRNKNMFLLKIGIQYVRNVFWLPI